MDLFPDTALQRVKCLSESTGFQVTRDSESTKGHCLLGLIFWLWSCNKLLMNRLLFPPRISIKTGELHASAGICSHITYCRNWAIGLLYIILKKINLYSINYHQDTMVTMPESCLLWAFFAVIVEVAIIGAHSGAEKALYFSKVYYSLILS